MNKELNRTFDHCPNNIFFGVVKNQEIIFLDPFLFSDSF